MILFSKFFVLKILLCVVLIHVDVCGSELNSFECEVVIVGGSLSALAAAIASSHHNVSTCLIEPTNWLGGQMTSSGVPAIDFCWHTLKSHGKTFPVYEYCRKKENITPLFFDLLQNDFSSTGDCWVSEYCFLPYEMITKGINKIVSKYPSLKIFNNTVIKQVRKTEENNIVSIEVIQRFPTNETKCGGYDFLLHEDIEDWYNENNSTRFTKSKLEISGQIFIEGSEWGELLALSEAPYLQGISEKFDGDISRTGGNETCGQSSVFGFTEKYNPSEIKEPPNPYPVQHADYYSFEDYTWDKIFTYRRLYTSSKYSKEPQKNDITLQNWGSGNDDPFGYIFKSFKETELEVLKREWKGGVVLDLLEDSSFLSYGWHYYFKKNTPSQIQSNLFMEKESIESSLGTCTGLSKMPYIRDTRRTIGIDDFIMNVTDISGDFILRNYTGTKFDDRVAIGCYDVDVHKLQCCDYPDYIVDVDYPVLPFYIPFRSMTSKSFENLLVTGKCIGQSFLVSSATRTHPTEFSTGTATGSIAAWMIQNKIFDVKKVYVDYMNEVQEFVKLLTPIDWDLT